MGVGLPENPEIGKKKTFVLFSQPPGYRQSERFQNPNSPLPPTPPTRFFSPWVFGTIIFLPRSKDPGFTYRFKKRGGGG